MITTPEVLLAECAERLRKGAAEYGNRSFVRDEAEIIDEIAQEWQDVVGWLYVLWRKRNGCPGEEAASRIVWLRAVQRALEGKAEPGSHLPGIAAVVLLQARDMLAGVQ